MGGGGGVNVLGGLNKGLNWLSGTLNNILNAPIPSGSQWLAGWRAGWSGKDVTYTQAGRIFVTTPRGVTYRIPANYWSETAANGKGIVFRPLGSTDNANSIRIMDPTASYPNGYVRVYNSYGQPLNQYGKPGSQADTHFAEDSGGDTPPGWEADVIDLP
jgi:hypothetical protein